MAFVIVIESRHTTKCRKCGRPVERVVTSRGGEHAFDTLVMLPQLTGELATAHVDTVRSQRHTCPKKGAR